ncbi:hypothetical protein D3C80_1918830 [compost metagenome]
MTRPGPREAAGGARVAGDCDPEALRPPKPREIPVTSLGDPSQAPEDGAARVWNELP